MEKRYLTRQIPSKWPFSHGVAIKNPGTIIILAGQVAFDRHGPNRQLVGPGDLAAQTRQAVQNIRTLEYFTDPLPTLTLIGVKALAFPALLIEIRAVAILPDRPATRRGKPARKQAVRKRRR